MTMTMITHRGVDVCVMCSVCCVLCAVCVVWCGWLSPLRCCMSVVVWWVFVAGCVSVVVCTKRDVTSMMGSKNEICYRTQITPQGNCVEYGLN